MPNGGIERHNAATRRIYDKKYPDNRQFRGVDGEGGNVPEEGALFGSRHQYLSLRAGPDILETGRPLTWENCLSFLSDLAPKYIYVAYFFDYDVTMIIRTLPVERVRRLFNRELRTSKTGNILPLEVGDFEIDYLPHKEFRVRRKGRKGWIVINDVGQFFQTSFLATLKRWDIGTPDEQEMIRKGKLQRADFTYHNAEIQAYNALECVLLEQLMTNFRAVCWETNYVPKKWQGPGHLASAMLDAHNVPRRDDIPILSNKSFSALAQAAYYGGRFETTVCGQVHGPVYQYDINGAYVHMLRSLPCLIHGSWRRVRERPIHGLWFGRVSFTHDPGKSLYNLPFRTSDGNIKYPREGIGVYWSNELEAAERTGTHITFESGYVYECECECRWFDFVDAYYQRRLALGKSSKGYVLKLAGNSIYGKLAQSIGYAPWANPVWAGIITAGCRALLINAYTHDIEGTYMLATDGIFCSSKLPLPVSKKLGEWEETIHPDGIFIIQPGIYFAGKDVKTRGVEHVRIEDQQEDFRKAFENYRGNPGGEHFSVKVTVQNFITAKQALARNRWPLAGVWETTTRDISFYWGIKRKAGLAFWRDGMLRTVPYDGDPDAVSISYSRIIGGNIRGVDIDSPMAMERARLADQPDWVTPALLSNRYIRWDDPPVVWR